MLMYGICFLYLQEITNIIPMVYDWICGGPVKIR